MKSLIYFIIFILISVNCFAADVVLQWQANTEPDLAGYKIYYDTKPGIPYEGDSINGRSPVELKLDDLKDKANPEYTMKGLNKESRWYFVVTAYDTEGLESDYSNEVSTNDYSAPGSPKLNIKVIVNIEVQ
jgi:hypothetical protein